MLIIDPPSGWKYGFPKPFTKTDDQTMEEWLREEGLPEELIEVAVQYGCRFWESNENISDEKGNKEIG